MGVATASDCTAVRAGDDERVPSADPKRWMAGLTKSGWVRVPGVTLAELWVHISGLGRLNRPERLVAMDSSARAPRTLTGLHGLARFPFHTDGAAERVPPAFITL